MSQQASVADRIATSPIVERLTALHPKLIDLSTDRIQRLLRDLGDPHLRLPKVIHVAGTNGKGSTCAFLRALLNEAGYTVNVYTSPHLVRFTERVRLNTGPISEDAFLAVLEHCECVNAGRQITFFEMLTAAAFVAFAENPADATIVEVGLGGRYDATNVFPSPAISAITPISLDHVEFLGSKLTQIAWEKAGILKPNRPAVCAMQPSEVLETIQAEATNARAQLATEGTNWKIIPDEDSFRFCDGNHDWELPRPALAGNWQFNNAGLALAALSRLEGFELTEKIAAHAMKTVTWPGRLQLLQRGPLLQQLGQRSVWVDGGHNPGAADALASEIARWPVKPTVIIGMMQRKDATNFLKKLAPVVKRAACVGIPGNEGALTADSLAVIARDVGIEAEAFKSIEKAAGDIALSTDSPVLICGSLYLAGIVLRENN